MLVFFPRFHPVPPLECSHVVAKQETVIVGGTSLAELVDVMQPGPPHRRLDTLESIRVHHVPPRLVEQVVLGNKLQVKISDDADHQLKATQSMFELKP